MKHSAALLVVAFALGALSEGAGAGDLPVERPARLDFVLNLKTAKALRLTIPQSVLIRADRVIE